jgi:hypothetical protein
MVDDILHLFRMAVREYTDYRTAKSLDGRFGVKPLWTVVSNDRKLVSRLITQR